MKSKYIIFEYAQLTSRNCPQVLVDAQSGEWRGNPCVYQCVESLLDRATDFVRAAVAQRAVLGAGMVLDETLDLTPVNSPEEGADKSRASLLPNTAEEQVDYDEVSDYFAVTVACCCDQFQILNQNTNAS